MLIQTLKVKVFSHDTMYSGKHPSNSEEHAASNFSEALKYSFFFDHLRYGGSSWTTLKLDVASSSKTQVSNGELHDSAILHPAIRCLLPNISRPHSGLIFKGQMSNEFNFFTGHSPLEDEITTQPQNFWQQTPCDRAQYPRWLKNSFALL